jgi:hypothetical protein
VEEQSPSNRVIVSGGGGGKNINFDRLLLLLPQSFTL